MDCLIETDQMFQNLLLLTLLNNSGKDNIELVI